MTRPHANEATPIAPGPRVRAGGPPHSPGAPRWGLWLASVVAATGAIFVVTLTGAASVAKGVPAAIQVGRQASSLVASVTVPSTLAPPSRPPASSTTTTTVQRSHSLTVVRPRSTVTLHEDTRERDRSNPANPASATTVPTVPPPSDSTAINPP